MADPSHTAKKAAIANAELETRFEEAGALDETTRELLSTGKKTVTGPGSRAIAGPLAFQAAINRALLSLVLDQQGRIAELEKAAGK